VFPDNAKPGYSEYQNHLRVTSDCPTDITGVQGLREFRMTMSRHKPLYF